jgi:hypothetical protein
MDMWEGERGFLLFNVEIIGLQFLKVIIHLQSFFCSIGGLNVHGIRKR